MPSVVLKAQKIMDFFKIMDLLGKVLGWIIVILAILVLGPILLKILTLLARI